MNKNYSQSDTRSDRSDVLSLLTTIEDMFRISQQTLNEYSRTSLLLSIAIEGQMLLLKLQVMYERWQTHLPFKEACGVDFYDWAKKIETVLKKIDNKDDTAPKKNDAYCPSKHFLLDLYAILPKTEQSEKPYYLETDISSFIGMQEHMRRVMVGRWPEYKHKLSDHTILKINERETVNLDPFHDNVENIRNTCISVLTELTAELSRLSGMSLRVVKGDEYARLAERIIHETEYGGEKAERDAKAYFSSWKNRTPEEQADADRKYEIEIAVNFISEMKYGRFLGRYVHLKDDMDKQMKGIGKFLYTYRLEISIDELQRLMQQLFRIHFFLEDERKSKAETGLQPTATTADDAQAIQKDASSVTDIQECDIKLPTIFHHDLRTNREATALLIKKLRVAGKYMGRNLTKKEKEHPEAQPYVLWMWHYLMQAFLDLEFIIPETTQVDFSKFLAQVLPGKKEANIRQSIYRNCDKKSASVVADIRDAFLSVKRLIK